MLGDPVAEFCDEKGQVHRPFESISLPGGVGGGWVWLSDWNLEPSGEVGKECDRDGWEYASNYNGFNQRTQGRALQRDVDSCRRRRWR